MVYQFNQETYLGFLVANPTLLRTYGYSEEFPVKTMADMETLISDIIQNERGADNFNLVGITNYYSGNDMLMKMAKTWYLGRLK